VPDRFGTANTELNRRARAGAWHQAFQSSIIFSKVEGRYRQIQVLSLWREDASAAAGAALSGAIAAIGDVDEVFRIFASSSKLLSAASAAFSAPISWLAEYRSACAEALIEASRSSRASVSRALIPVMVLLNRSEVRPTASCVRCFRTNGRST
jgi:hypothetical protein